MDRIVKQVCVACLLVMSGSGSITVGQTVAYVDDDAPPNGDGLTWETAFTYLQDALKAEVVVDEIRIAQGVYLPDRDATNPEGTLERDATFEIPGGVTLRGGYGGGGEADPDERDFGAFETILSGDLAGDDTPEHENRDDNSLHIITVPDADDPVVLDGCTIRGGFANVGDERGGAGIRLESGMLCVADCVFSGNTSYDYGGGVYAAPGTTVMIDGCELTENTADHGGGVAIESGSLLVSDCMFRHNSNGIMGIDSVMMVESSTFAWHYEWYGAGINSENSSLFVTHSRFLANIADFGGGLHIENGEAVVGHSEFVGNDTGGGHSSVGAAMSSFGADVALLNCVFMANGNDIAGVALLCVGHSYNYARVTNCIYWKNEPEVFYIPFSNRDLTYLCCESSVQGAGNIRGNPLVVREPNPGPDLRWRTDDDDYGDLSLRYDSPCIDAGCNYGVGIDITDLDRDGDMSELMPLDLAGEGRFYDPPEVEDTGCGVGPIVDIGAYEYGGNGPEPCLGDLNGDRMVALPDLAELLGAYNRHDGGDLDCDGDTDLVDLAQLLDRYGDVCD